MNVIDKNLKTINQNQTIGIIVCKKNRNGNKGNILFVDASKEYEPGKNQNVLTNDGIQKVLRTYQERADVERFAHVASMDEIERNGYNLNIPRYVDTSEEEEMIDIASNKKALLAIEAIIKEWRCRLWQREEQRFPIMELR